MPGIDPSARVADGARVADDVEVGPFCVVGPQVELRTGVRLLSHVNVAGETVVGERTVVYPFASLGTPPQSLLTRGKTQLFVGADCTIRECVTMNTGTGEHAGVTRVGDRGYFMAYSHVGHDCQVGNDVIFANSATVGGHCHIGDFAFLGGLVGVHQFTRVGAHSIIGGASATSYHIIPFSIANGIPATLRGINLVGLRRRKFSADAIRDLRTAYRMLFVGEGAPWAERVAAVEAELGHEPAVAQLIAFIRNATDRPLSRPVAGKEESED